MYTVLSGNKIRGNTFQLILSAQSYPDNQKKAHENKYFSYGHRTKMLHDILAKQWVKHKFVIYYDQVKFIKRI